MEKLMKNTNKSLLLAIFFVATLVLSISSIAKVNAYDGGYYGSGYDSYYGSGYDSGYGGYYDSGYGSYYDSGYGGYYDSGYGSYYDSGYGGYYDSGYGSYYDSGYGSYYGGYDDYCYDCVPYYDDYCYTCEPIPPCTTCEPIPPTPNLVVSCVPSRHNSDVGESITWTANVSGGSGSVSYSWSGTDGLSGSGSQITKTYNSPGSKNAHVTVTSGGRTASADCGTVYVQEDQNDLTGSCDVDDSNIDVDESVTWYAEASGGTGSYTYEWSGSSPLSGKTGRRVDVEYSRPGTKTGTVTIRSGNQSITRSCGTVYVEEEEDEDLDVSCTVNDTSVSIGQTVRWDVDADGGDGNYRYSWSGTDGISGNNSSLSRSFNTIGTKYATVRVTSDGQSESVNCPIVVVGGLTYAPPAAPASLSAVYLNQVPYTGIEDNPKFIAFIIGLFMFSALAAYMIVSRKARTERKNKILDFKNENMARRGLR